MNTRASHDDGRSALDRWVVVVPTGDIPVRIIEIGPDPGTMLRREIDCRILDCVGLDNGLDMWIDDEGAVLAEPVINTRASGVVLALTGTLHQLYCGHVVFTGVAGGQTIGLTRAYAAAIRDRARREGWRIEAYLAAHTNRPSAR